MTRGMNADNAMYFGVLGPLIVRDGEKGITVAAAKLRVLLAALLTHPNQPVSLPELADMLWDGTPPDRAADTIRTYVMRLRRVLGPTAGRRIVTKDPGYCVTIARDELDATRFDRLCRDGGAAFRASDWPRAITVLAQALSLWRGTPLADVPSEWLHIAEVPRLAELRLQALHWRIEAGLRLGRAEELLPELQALTARHPMLENFHSLLMLALAQSGRQAEALAVYQRMRTELVDELGIEPNAEFRRLHQRVLAGEDDLFAL